MKANRRQEEEMEAETSSGGGGGGGGGGEIENPSFPMGRVKRIVKLDKDINKVNSEALFLISLSSQLFISSLTQSARDEALRKKRRTIKLDNIRSAVRDQRRLSDFLLDCLPAPPTPKAHSSASAEKKSSALPPGSRRIDHFFQKAQPEATE